MPNRFDRDPEREALYEKVTTEATAADRALASLLMETAFGGYAREEETRIGQLYLMQAWNIARNPDMRERFRAMLET